MMSVVRQERMGKYVTYLENQGWKREHPGTFRKKRSAPGSAIDQSFLIAL